MKMQTKHIFNNSVVITLKEIVCIKKTKRECTIKGKHNLIDNYNDVIEFIYIMQFSHTLNFSCTILRFCTLLLVVHRRT